MEEEINQPCQKACTPASIPTQTLLGLIKSNSNSNENQQLYAHNQNAFHENINSSQASSRQMEEEINMRQQKSVTQSSGKTCVLSSNNQKMNNSQYSTTGFNSGQQFQIQSPCNQYSLYSPQQMAQKDHFASQIQQLEEMSSEMDEKTQGFFIKSAEKVLQNQIGCQQQQNNSINQLNQQNIMLCQQGKLNGLQIEDLDSAQQPYPTKQKKQIQPCCAQECSDRCKYTQFLFSIDQQAQLEALRYFERNLKDYNPNDLLRLFNQKFIDCLVEKSKNYKQEKQIAMMSMKVIFNISRLQSSQLIFNNRNIFFDKLLALEFPSVLSKFKQDKVAPKTPCCLSFQIDETNIKLKKYQFEQDSQNKPKACFLSSFFK